MYLTRAECYARKGAITEAMNDLNALMIKRWKNDGSFKPFTATSMTQALAYILAERQKELIYRGLRWMDLRRLNMANAQITPMRFLDNTIYTLAPNSPRYVYPIPVQEIEINPMAQNDR
jgi:hypothetical protein